MAQHGDGIDTCLVCGDGVYSRGLCARHHTQFHRRKKGMTQKQAERYEAALIDLNMLAPPKPTGRIAKDDPFAAIADKIRTGSQIPTPGQPTDDALAKQGSQAINKAKAKQAAKQTKKQATASKTSKRSKKKRG